MNSLVGKTVLLTGASGFIGSHLRQRLSKVPGIILLLLSRQVQHTKHNNMQWLKGELKDLSPNFWLLHGSPNIDTVFHLGAFTPKRNSDSNNIEKIFSANLNGTCTLLEGLPASVTKIIFSSTIDVYDIANKGAILTERSYIKPSGLYGASKVFCEQLISVWAKKNNCKFIILRYGHVFGSGEEAYGKLIPFVIKELLRGQEASVYGTGRAKRDFIYIDDAVEATMRAANVDDDIKAINIVRGVSHQIQDVVKILVAKIRPEQNIHYIIDKQDGHSLHFNNNMMQEILGKWPLVSLADGLEKEITAFRGLNNAK